MRYILAHIRILFWAIIPMFAVGQNAFAETIVVTTADCQLIGEKLSYFEDRSQTLSVREIMERKADFQQNESPVFTDIAKSSTYWFRFSVINQTNRDIWVDISNSNLTDVHLYEIGADNQIKDSVLTGCLMDDSTRITQAYTFQFPVAQANDTEKHDFLVSIETLLVFEVPIYIGSYQNITVNRNWYDYISAFFVGGVLLLLLYNLFIYFVTYDKIYLYYVWYLLSTIIIGTYLNNFPIIEHVLGKTIAYEYLDTWLWLIFGTTGAFTIAYFNLRQTYPLFYKIITIEMYGFILFGVANLFIPLSEIANYYQLWAVLFYVTCLALGYLMWYRGYERARLYCIGWTGMMFGALMYLMVYNGYLPYNPFFRNISYFGALFEILVFSIALGQRINHLMVKGQELNKTLRSKNQELINLNESLDSFNYHVSHDLKTVLNNTRALTRMAKKYTDKNDQQKVYEVLGRLAQVNDNGVETVQSFLSLGRVDHIFQEENDMVSLKDEIYKILERNDLIEKIAVQIDEDQIKYMKVHEKALESIFLNLFTNTIKYNEGKPKAIISFLNNDEKYCFHYVDNGVGIDLDKYGDRLFKPFQRANETSSKEGTGVGLYLIKKIMSHYNGTIEVESELGQGTTFTMCFPKIPGKQTDL